MAWSSSTSDYYSAPSTATTALPLTITPSPRPVLPSFNQLFSDADYSLPHTATNCFLNRPEVTLAHLIIYWYFHPTKNYKGM